MIGTNDEKCFLSLKMNDAEVHVVLFNKVI